jgi:MFS family permease
MLVSKDHDMLTISAGISLSFGVFQDYYSNQVMIPNHSQASWIGVLSVGLGYLGTPLLTYLVETFTVRPHYYVCGGWLLCVIALLASAFCHTVKALIVTQGLLFGLGVLIVEMPALIILNGWFRERRGLFFGVLCASIDLFGVGWTFLAGALLSRYGLRTTFLSMAAIAFFVPGMALFFLRDRAVQALDTNPPACTSDKQKPASASVAPARYYHRPLFYLFVSTTIIQSLVFYLPFIYLPSFTTSFGHSVSTGAMVLAVANVAQIFGEAIFGQLSDKISLYYLIVISTLVACLCDFLLWGLATSLAYVITFAVLYGGFASGFVSLWARMAMQFAEKDETMIFSFLSCARGIAVIASGPISAALVNNNNEGGQKYKRMVIFVGVGFAASASLGCIGWALSIMRSKHCATRGEDEPV